MDYLRKNDNINLEDFKVVKQILAVNEVASDLHSCRRSSALHLRMFFNFYRMHVLQSYELEKSIEMIRSSNPDISNLQRKLAHNFNWSVFYNTPIYVVIIVNFSLLTFVISALTAMKIYRVTRKEAVLWYNNLLKVESREYLQGIHNNPMSLSPFFKA